MTITKIDLKEPLFGNSEVTSSTRQGSELSIEESISIMDAEIIKINEKLDSLFSAMSDLQEKTVQKLHFESYQKTVSRFLKLRNNKIFNINDNLSKTNQRIDYINRYLVLDNEP